MEFPMRKKGRTGLDPMEEIELFGADGEETVYRLLCDHFGCVIRNPMVPHKSFYLEKDFLVLHGGSLFVIEVKNWKGTVGCRDGVFYQDKENGVHKELKSPVDTTNHFIGCMKKFYGISRPVWGIVAFTDPSCKLSLPGEMDGIALLRLEKLVAFLCKRAAKEKDAFSEVVDPSRILRCTRLYDTKSEFCKGILANVYLECRAEDGAWVRLDTTKLRYLTVEPYSRRESKLYVTFAGGGSGVFFAPLTDLDMHCLDGSWARFSLERIRYIVF